jgi:hypothetical protein
MINDPIVEEVHRIRESIAAKFNFNVRAMLDDIEKRQKLLGDRLVYRRSKSAEAIPAADEPTTPIVSVTSSTAGQ